MKSLYEITDELLQIDQAFDEQDEITTKDKEIFDTVISELEHKTDGVCGYFDYQKDIVFALKERVKKINSHIKSVENKIKRFEQYVINCMDKIEIEEFHGKTNRLKIRKPAIVVDILDENLIPPQYIKVTKDIKIDKVSIKRDLKNDIEIEGATLAESANRSLQISIKK